MSNNDILTGIVTYNPDIKRLKENIDAAVLQVGKMLIIDNGSKNYNDIDKLVKDYAQIDLIESESNKGIAHGLTILMRHAIERGYKWVLSLDQDSVILPGLIDRYIKESEKQNAGALTCELMDRNYTKTVVSEAAVVDVNECFTSGFFLSCDAYVKTEGYDDTLFIDYVDYDICYKLLEAEEKIKKVNYVGVLHEYGNAKYKWLFWKKVIVTNHPAWRKYYMTRNILWMNKKHRPYVSRAEAYHIIASILIKSIAFEKDKIRSVIAVANGIKDGILYSN